MEARFIDKSELKDSCRKLLACLGIGLLSVVMFTLLSSPLKAQSLYGSVVGTVTDASGAIVPGAAVTLINIGTNEKRTAQTDAAGDYRFVDLLPANYRLEVERASFKRLTRELINVQVGSEVRINATLEVGATTETVQVTSRTPLLQTESGTQSSVVEGEVVQEMPLNGRNTMNLLALTPGVVPQGGTAGSSSLNRGNHTDVVGFGNYQIGGGIAGQGAMYIDGAPINVLIANQVRIDPHPGLRPGVSRRHERRQRGIRAVCRWCGGNEYQERFQRMAWLCLRVPQEHNTERQRFHQQFEGSGPAAIP